MLKKICPPWKIRVDFFGSSWDLIEENSEENAFLAICYRSYDRMTGLLYNDMTVRYIRNYRLENFEYAILQGYYEK